MLDAQLDLHRLHPLGRGSLHAAAFVVLTAIGSVERRARLIIFLALTGAGIEILQGTQIISRDMDIFDWFADCVGIACGLAIASWTKKLVSGFS
ncbi:MAG: hypothetical protein E5W98_21390 [Mesorhizobium sp.]|nr:MAG: hypothetical protein E5W87_00045 [Mesorhizobium sp.]TKD40212.1 MAG: hypothetical protein E5W98_21390 [Mesorhizobium sp.]